MDHEHKHLDRIYIEDLKLSCIIGINEDERLNQQDIVINITIFADLSKACQTDNIKDTVDYKKLKTTIVAMVRNSSYYLIERLADHIARICLEIPLIEKVIVKVDKPLALTYARTVRVEITRTRDMI
ncbi:MAG: dihydroneopterin aldolase [Spirochaetales bacterium]|nr:dihydroneopterin aldolase [Spirochaetales bacterium]